MYLLFYILIQLNLGVFFVLFQCWLDHEKGILKQLPHPDSPLEFFVKFFTPDPGLLDEFTRFVEINKGRYRLIVHETTIHKETTHFFWGGRDYFLQYLDHFGFLHVVGPHCNPMYSFGAGDIFFT